MPVAHAIVAEMSSTSCSYAVPYQDTDVLAYHKAKVKPSKSEDWVQMVREYIGAFWDEKLCDIATRKETLSRGCIGVDVEEVKLSQKDPVKK